jgi:hypothetical protein
LGHFAGHNQSFWTLTIFITRTNNKGVPSPVIVLVN